MRITSRSKSSTPLEDADEKSQRAVQSVEVGGRLLLALANSAGSLGLKELAERADLTPSRAHPYLVSYGRLELIEQDSMGKYDLGPAALKVGLACLQRLDPLKAAEPVIRALAAKTGHAVALSVWGNLGPTVVRLIEARQPLHISLRIGSVLSLFDTATGRAFAAALPIDRLQQAVAGPSGDLLPPGALKVRLKELEVIKAEAHEHGISRALGSPIPGVNAFSVAAFDLEGAPALVLTITDHQDRLSGDWKNSAAQALRDAAREVTARLGGR